MAKRNMSLLSRRNAITRRSFVQGLGLAGLAVAFGSPALAQQKPIRVGWIARVGTAEADPGGLDRSGDWNVRR
jgi:hypothetical protein